MSRVLSELLNQEEPLFSLALKQLEQSSGNMSVDVRLTAEIVGKVHVKIRSLGLDPADTTGDELYAALIGLMAKHDKFLANRIGCSDPEDVDVVLSRVKQTVQALDVPKSAWVLKHTVAKRLLKSLPPTHLMNHLNYRSIDSMLKRESIAELFAGVHLLESQAYMTKLIQSYKSLKPTDFETQPIEIVYLDAAKWGKATAPYVQNKHHNILRIQEVGAVIIMPVPIKRSPGITITALSLVLHNINEIRLYSSYFKSQQVRPNFAQTIINTLIDDPGKHAEVGDQHVHWRVIHKHFGSNDREHPDIFEPHVEPNDLIWLSAEETLYKLEPALHFWYDMDYVGVRFADQLVSFNLMDMAVSFVNNLAYGQHYTQHLQASLWNEIYLRYMGEKTVEKHVLNQLSHGMIDTNAFAAELEGNL